MNKQFVPLELVKKLKKKGFEDPCLAQFHKNANKKWDLYVIETYNWSKANHVIGAPTYHQIINWFKTKHNIIIEARLSSYTQTLWETNNESQFKFRSKVFHWDKGEMSFGEFETIEEALNVSIAETLKLI